MNSGFSRKTITNNSVFTNTCLSGQSLFGDIGSFNGNLLDQYKRLSEVSITINEVLLEFALGNFEQVSQMLSQDKYKHLSVQLYRLMLDISTYPEYEIIRHTSLYSIEGLYQSIYQYASLKDTQNKLNVAATKTAILTDLRKMSACIESLKNTTALFPDSVVTSIPATVKPEFAEYIRLYGYPQGGIFDATKLAEILIRLKLITM